MRDLTNNNVVLLDTVGVCPRGTRHARPSCGQV